MKDIRNSQCYNNCKSKIAEIFQYNNDYCLKGCQDYTHPDIS